MVAFFWPRNLLCSTSVPLVWLWTAKTDRAHLSLTSNSERRVSVKRARLAGIPARAAFVGVRKSIVL
jgi:hypothetical protein